MQVSYTWLKELVPDLTATAAELEEKMSTTGIEAEGVTSPSAGLSNLTVGQILTAEKIPETHLYLTQVDVAAKDGVNLQIVCGARNVRVGMKVIVALVGARIADGVKIKKGKIRGVESQGMLCALDELGIPDAINPMKHEDGIFELPADAVVGADALAYLGMDDEIIELAITPNRADALSMRGVAYEVGAIYGLPVKFDSVALQEVADKAAEKLAVKVETKMVPTYKLRVIEQVKIAPSPLWLQTRLMNAGIRPINNVVDVTNYVLMYYGQPLHAFDFDALADNQILVRQAQKSEKMTTLDHVERELSEEDIVIATNGGPQALAGVMGGLDSEIIAKTTTVALEAALFDGASIRKTAQKFGLRSEASSRFEKGINQGTVEEALNYAAVLIAELSGGQILSGVVASNDYQPQEVSVAITLPRINQSLGTDLTTNQVSEIFQKLGFRIDEEINGNYQIVIPPRRWDISIEADLIEEVARIYGYDRLPSTLPASSSSGQLSPLQAFRRKIRTRLEGAGLSEVLGYSLTSPQKSTAFVEKPGATTQLILPMTEERTNLRLSLIPGLLDIVSYNQNRKQSDLAIYEVGTIFKESRDERPEERPQIAFALTGNWQAKTYQSQAQATDYFSAKGIVEDLLAEYADVEFTAAEPPEMHPGRTAQIKIAGKVVGFVGQVHPAIAKAYGTKEVYVASIDVLNLLEVQPQQTIFREIPKFPAVSRDIAFLIQEEISHGEVLAAISGSRVKTLVAIDLFDLYQGNNLPQGMKSLAYNLTFQKETATLTDEEINAAMKKITQKLTETFGAQIR